MMWHRQSFDRAMGHEVVKVDGYTYRGLGLVGVDIGKWWLVHLNSGHGVCRLLGMREQVQHIGALVAEATDWDFDGIKGWENRDPDLPKKLNAIAALYPGKLSTEGQASPNDRSAQAVARSRMEDE